MAEDTFIAAFASPIFLRHYGKSTLTGDLAEAIRGLAATQSSDDLKRAHQGGFYTKGTLLTMDLPGIAELRNVIASAVTDYVRRLVPGNERPKIELIAWAALTHEGDYQTPHVHAGANVSGVFYLTVPEKPEPEGCIDLLTPVDLQEMTFLKGFSKTYCRVQPRPGDLLIFPAYLKHIVHPFFGEGERIAVVFNAAVQPT